MCSVLNRKTRLFFFTTFLTVRSWSHNRVPRPSSLAAHPSHHLVSWRPLTRPSLNDADDANKPGDRVRREICSQHRHLFILTPSSNASGPHPIPHPPLSLPRGRASSLLSPLRCCLPACLSLSTSPHASPQSPSSFLNSPRGNPARRHPPVPRARSPLSHGFGCQPHAPPCC